MPVATITKRTVDSAAPGFLWDAEVRGFGLKVSAGGGKVYVLQYRTGGRGSPTKRWTIGRHGAPWTPDQARREAKRLLGEVAAGRDPAAERRSKHERAKQATENTVRAVAEQWLARDQAHNRTVAEVRRILEREVLPSWGERPIETIRKRDVIALIDGIADRAPIRANRVLAWVRRLFNWAAGRDLVESNPAQFVEKPTPERKRDRVLDDGELVEVWRACEGWQHPFARGVQLLTLTLARRAELFEASWPEIELDVPEPAIRLPAERVKVAEARVIPLSEPAVEILRALPRFADGDLVLSFTGCKPIGNLGHLKAELDRRTLAARRNADPKAKPIPAWRLHDLRRSGATGLQRLGIRLEVVEAVLGHVAGSRGGIVGVYQRHRFEAEARQALDAWARHVEALASGKPAKVVALRRPPAVEFTRRG